MRRLKYILALVVLSLACTKVEKEVESNDTDSSIALVIHGGAGYITPERNMMFNIPIRTILLQKGKAEMGIGGGIVWDSTPQGEWDEGHWKARFLTDLSLARPQESF